MAIDSKRRVVFTYRSRLDNSVTTWLREMIYHSNEKANFPSLILSLVEDLAKPIFSTATF